MILHSSWGGGSILCGICLLNHTNAIFPIVKLDLSLGHLYGALTKDKNHFENYQHYAIKHLGRLI